jgi:hypothetical protein
VVWIGVNEDDLVSDQMGEAHEAPQHGARSACPAIEPGDGAWIFWTH